MIDLQRFCFADDTRPEIVKPFSLGSWTYATNGHICVRVPRRDDIPERAPKAGPMAEKLFAREPPQFRHPNFPALPDEEKTACICYEGREHDCPECTCTCDLCNGTGLVSSDSDWSVDIGGAPFALNYIRQIAQLSGIQVPVIVDRKAPMPFRFEGGEGVLMPMNAQRRQHIETSPQSHPLETQRRV